MAYNGEDGRHQTGGGDGRTNQGRGIPMQHQRPPPQISVTSVVGGAPWQHHGLSGFPSQIRITGRVDQQQPPRQQGLSGILSHIGLEATSSATGIYISQQNAQNFVFPGPGTYNLLDHRGTHHRYPPVRPPLGTAAFGGTMPSGRFSMIPSGGSAAAVFGGPPVPMTNSGSAAATAVFGGPPLPMVNSGGAAPAAVFGGPPVPMVNSGGAAHAAPAARNWVPPPYYVPPRQENRATQTVVSQQQSAWDEDKPGPLTQRNPTVGPLSVTGGQHISVYDDDEDEDTDVDI